MLLTWCHAMSKYAENISLTLLNSWAAKYVCGIIICSLTMSVRSLRFSPPYHTVHCTDTILTGIWSSTHQLHPLWSQLPAQLTHYDITEPQELDVKGHMRQGFPVDQYLWYRIVENICIGIREQEWENECMARQSISHTQNLTGVCVCRDGRSRDREKR